jgi:sensor histidine kinase YesM
MKTNRRNLSNWLVNPSAQIKFGTWFLSASLIVHLVITVIAIRFYMSWLTRSEDISGERLIIYLVLIGAIFVLFYALAFAMGIVISHKIYGPFVNINRRLQEYIQGDYKNRIKLRQGDDEKVAELAANINRLIDRLDRPLKDN